MGNGVDSMQPCRQPTSGLAGESRSGYPGRGFVRGRLVLFGLLARRLFVDLVATAALALLAVTGVMTLVMAMVFGGHEGLDPVLVLKMTPFFIPSMLPYTLPTCLLYACTVVYGGMSGNNEITAVKAGGIPPLGLAWPALVLGAAVAVGGLVVTDRVIPACNRALRAGFVSDPQTAVLTALKSNGNRFNSAGYHLHAQQIRDNELINPIVKALKPDGKTTQFTLSAERGLLRVLPGAASGAPAQLEIRLFNGQASGKDAKGEASYPAVFREWTFLEQLPDMQRAGHERIETLTYRECLQRSDEYRRRLALDASEAAFGSALDILGGNLLGPYSPAAADERKARAADNDRLLRKSIETIGEVHLRAGLSLAGLAFAMLGVPLSILLQRRDALQTFFVCFVPIVTLFYPSMILAFNAFKELRGLENYHSAAWLLWTPVAVLTLAALVALRKLARS